MARKASVAVARSEAFQAGPFRQGERAAPSLRRRVARFAIATLSAVIFLTAIGAALLLLLTPPASQAASRARAEARSHGVALPASPPPDRFVQALIATEDHRFFSAFDPGVDLFAVARVAIGLLKGREGDLGGSTIEQQLAKMLYTPGRRSLGAKLEQVAIGVKIRFSYSKQAILTMYSEVVYFGDGNWGLRNASCNYFGKRPQDLSWPQAALLAGVVNGPSIFNPRAHPAGARRRQAHVLDRLVAVGDLSRSEATAYFAQPLGLTKSGCSNSK